MNLNQVKEQTARHNKIVSALRILFHESVLQLALVGAVVVALFEGAASLNPGSFV